MTGENDNHQTEDFAPDGALIRLFRGPRDPRYKLVVATFILGSASHLWLLDAAHPDWMPANAVYVAGLILLAITRGPAGWWLCTVGLLVPLLFHRDQLTQSALYALISAMGGLLVYMDANNRGNGAFQFAVPAFLKSIRGLTIATYLFAAFHKLNRDFFDVSTGCTSYGLREIAEYYGFASDAVDPLGAVHAYLAVGLELAIPLAYLLGRRHIGRTLGVIFHLPLTLTMAPAFAFVMSVGHAAFLTNEDRENLVAWFRRWWKVVVPLGVAATGTSLALHGALPEVTMIPREFLLWLLLFWFVGYLPQALRERNAPLPDEPVTGWFRAVAVGAVVAFCLNCLTPYLGVQYQHTAAMLSNLRIDRGCWNHFIVPEAVRITDDYVRVDEVWFGEPGRIEEYEGIVLDQLWSPPQIRQMRRNWCRDEIRPFHMSGTFRDRTWTIEDLCDPDETWPFEDAGVFGVELFSDFLRYQKNLERQCPQTCIH